jgi:CHAD domain-containing protein
MSRWPVIKALMSYQLRAAETLGGSIRRILCKQIEGAMGASSTKQNGKSSPVHETRKHLKKARAALQMVASKIDDDLLEREDRRLRNVGRRISEIRDAEVRLDTVKQLRNFSHNSHNSNFQETEELLAFELDSFLAAFSDWEEEAAAKLKRIRNRVADWRIDDLTREEICCTVQKSYKRGRKALRTAMKKPTPARFHAFRKEAKELWYQLRILRPAHPAILKELGSDLKTLGQHLGHAHDLAFLRDRLATITGRKRGRRSLDGLIDSRRKDLQRIAAALGERFYAQPPKEFASRISEYLLEWEIAKIRFATGTVVLQAAA